MIRFNHIEKRFGKLQVLKDVDLALHDSQVVAMIGPNGSGKTTLLKSLLGLVVPDSGDIFVNNETVGKDWNYRKNIGYMPQISRFPDNLRIGELFDLMKDLRTDMQDYDLELYEAYHLHQMTDKRLGALSGGTRQKVSGALAFMFKPSVLVLDEPTAGLDPIATEIIKQKIQKEKANGKLVIITSHIMSDIEELADTIVYIIEGQIRFCWPISRVMERTGERMFSKAMAKISEVYDL